MDVSNEMARVVHSTRNENGCNYECVHHKHITSTHQSYCINVCNDLICSRDVIWWISDTNANIFPKILRRWCALLRTNLRTNVYFPFDSVITQLKYIEFIVRRSNATSIRFACDSKPLLLPCASTIAENLRALHRILTIWRHCWFSA